MGIRLTTWNVNGIRNPFGYQPWSRKRTFDAMFGILEADIVVMQELKIQRKDLKDDMVLVPGWDCFFSLPKHKKGYSGVGIYTRQSVCQPIRAEEGLLGGLCPPGSDVPYREMPEEDAIGGYPTHSELLDLGVDAAVLDSEGRCVVLEFPAFVLFGVYCPANTRGDEQGDAFRHAFWNALDLRIRNLDRLGKRVILTGDLNNVPNELDVAGAEDDKRKAGITHEDFVSTINRRIFNQLLDTGEVYGRRDAGREKPVLTDVCRNFHQTRQAMYTHWDQKKNTRPGNFGSRIDFILASVSMKTWFSASDIQEGLQGSDHCPVYADMDDEVSTGSATCHLLDIMNSPGVFSNGERLLDIPTKATLAFSARLLPEFNLSQRQSIRDMFQRSATSAPKTASSRTIPARTSPQREKVALTGQVVEASPSPQKLCESPASPMTSQRAVTAKRKLEDADGSRPSKSKRASASNTSPAAANGTLKAFFRPAAVSLGKKLGPQEADDGQAAAKNAPLNETGNPAAPANRMSPAPDSHVPAPQPALASNDHASAATIIASDTVCAPAAPTTAAEDAELGSYISKRMDSSERWGQLFRKAPPPRCEDHDEPCILLQTKVKTENQGRKFYICPRPLGPSGEKERKSQWRCRTYIWESEWRAMRARP